MLWRMLRKALFSWMLYLLDRSFELSSASRARHQNPSAFTRFISYCFAESMTFWNNVSIHINQQAKDIYFGVSCIRASAESKRITQALAVKKRTISSHVACASMLNSRRGVKNLTFYERSPS